MTTPVYFPATPPKVDKYLPPPRERERAPEALCEHHATINRERPLMDPACTGASPQWVVKRRPTMTMIFHFDRGRASTD